MNIQIEQRIPYKNMTTDVEVIKYYAHVKTHFMKNELCNDNGFSFYADVVRHKEELIPVSKSVYEDFKNQLKYKSVYEVVYRTSKVKDYDDYVTKISECKEMETILIAKLVQEYVETKDFKNAFKKLEDAKNQLNKQRVSYNHIFKDSLIDTWNEGVQKDLSEVEKDIQWIKVLQNEEVLRKERQKLNKIKNQYEKLLKEKEKYSDGYFATLEKEFFEKNQVSKESILSIEA